jgi:hypothetical protein
MALVTTQRFISGVTVYDTYNGRDGTISEMNLNSTATHPLSTSYVGPYFVVTFNDSTTQLFTLAGRRVINNAGDTLDGVTLVTSSEKIALMGAGYPA